MYGLILIKKNIILAYFYIPLLGIVLLILSKYSEGSIFCLLNFR